jgi:hypothetical protein
MFHFRGKEWTGKYSTDFSKLLPGLADNNETIATDEEEEETRFSLLTGTMKVNHKLISAQTSSE